MYKTILVPLDLSEESSWEKALPTAVEYCKTFGAQLQVMSVVPDFGMSMVGSFFPSGYSDDAVKEATTALADLCGRLVPGDMDAEQHIAFGNIYDEIIARAREVNADLIVMASHRPMLEDYLLGPNAARVVRHANCSVLVVRP